MTDCLLCGAELHRVALLGADEYAWADGDCHVMGIDKDLLPLEAEGGPYARLNALAAFMTASQKVAKGRPERLSATHWAAAREYSALKVRMDMSPGIHVHHARAGDSAPLYLGQVPEHCEWPMQLRPSGWHCRRCEHAQPGPERILLVGLDSSQASA
jgi:hypothetical protein